MSLLTYETLLTTNVARRGLYSYACMQYNQVSSRDIAQDSLGGPVTLVESSHLVSHVLEGHGMLTAYI